MLTSVWLSPARPVTRDGWPESAKHTSLWFLGGGSKQSRVAVPMTSSQSRNSPRNRPNQKTPHRRFLRASPVTAYLSLNSPCSFTRASHSGTVLGRGFFCGGSCDHCQAKLCPDPTNEVPLPALHRGGSRPPRPPTPFASPHPAPLALLAWPCPAVAWRRPGVPGPRAGWPAVPQNRSTARRVVGCSTGDPMPHRRPKSPVPTVDSASTPLTTLRVGPTPLAPPPTPPHTPPPPPPPRR